MKQLKVRDLKRARKQSLKELREPNLDDKFREYLDKAEDLYVKGLPTYEYQVKPGEVTKHLGFWQKHPVWNQCINSIAEKKYTKTNITLVIYFRN